MGPAMAIGVMMTNSIGVESRIVRISCGLHHGNGRLASMLAAFLSFADLL